MLIHSLSNPTTAIITKCHEQVKRGTNETDSSGSSWVAHPTVDVSTPFKSVELILRLGRLSTTYRFLVKGTLMLDLT